MSLGNKIIEIRKKSNLSQEQLAEKMNVTRQTISNWETEQTTPDINQANELCKIFKISLDELLNNNISNIIIDKISNTERLAGIIIKILKIIGIILIFSVILYVAVIIISIYAWNTDDKARIEDTSISINCTVDNKETTITLYSKKDFDCENCSNELIEKIKPLINYNNINTSIDKIADYIENNNGNC